ncbi:MAG: histidine utilization repressor [Geminicoccaceae bacterium]|nr:histidine utilization repressor [Geminicoccaceae bacterium]MCS7267439.1 histidine utilization repressor [Geminicoccaceae bacterium]MCX7630616.1 histidine utilization repressor [Geminicoccaceae bacterium]MDW8125063.1 histidine utilization repressor [Geminicoccaceae bacterium]MDW8342295.1 histidine utilization repressor [Geminicoccaceae bacterium]
MSERDRPLYERIKETIRAEIASGRLAPGARVPSEHELVRRFGVSRMTAHRALRELALEGVIVRTVGAGSFVAEHRLEHSALVVPDMAQEVRASGRSYRGEVLLRERVAAPPEVARALELAHGAEAFHLLLVHRADELPLQLEDRWVNPAFAPDFLEQEFAARTPNAYLTAIAPVEEAEEVIEAVAADREAARLLGIRPGEACLALTRRTFARGLWATTARLLAPGRRWRLFARFRP